LIVVEKRSPGDGRRTLLPSASAPQAVGEPAQGAPAVSSTSVLGLGRGMLVGLAALRRRSPESWNVTGDVNKKMGHYRGEFTTLGAVCIVHTRGMQYFPLSAAVPLLRAQAVVPRIGRLPHR